MRRVEEIRRLSKAIKWYHCPGVYNPADLATRGVQADQLSTSILWWTGPELLKSKEWQCKPVSEKSLLKEDALQEEVKSPVKTTPVDSSRFSSLQRLIRVTCYVYRFICKCRDREKAHEWPKSRSLTVDEFNNARNSWIRTV